MGSNLNIYYRLAYVEALKRYIGEAADEELEAAFSQLKLARYPR